MYTHLALEIITPRTSYVQFAELAFYDAAGTLVSEGGAPYANSEFWLWLAQLAFDGIPETQFSTTQPLPAGRLLIGTVLANPIAGITSYQITARDIYPEGIPETWRVGLSTGARLVRDPYDYDWVDVRRNVAPFAPGETRTYERYPVGINATLPVRLTGSSAVSSDVPHYQTAITARLGALYATSSAALTIPTPQQGTSVSSLLVGITGVMQVRHKDHREDVCEVTAIRRPEGGAVQLTFTLPDGYREVRVDRYPAGQTHNPVTIFEGVPQRAGRYRFGFSKSNPTDPQQRGMVYDLEAFSDRFVDVPNRIDTHTFDYWLMPKNDTGYTDDWVVVRNVTPKRLVHADMELDLKTTLYHRLRYHAGMFTEAPVWVGRQDHINGSQPMPQVLFKVRHVLTERPLGRTEQADSYTEHTSVFRAVCDIIVVCEDPGSRDRLGDHFRLHLLTDFGLLESLDYQSLKLNDQDNHINLPEINYYTRELSLEGDLDAYVTRVKDVTIPPIVVYPFEPYKCD